MKHESAFEGIELASLLAGIAVVDPVWDRKIFGIAQNHQQIEPGYLFIATVGAKHDARKFIAEAISRGAVAVIAQSHEAHHTDDQSGQQTPIFFSDKLPQQIGKIAARFFGHCSRHMQVIGITGTNGKTSCSQLLGQAFSLLGKGCGVIGTLGNGTFGNLQKSTHTTPDAIALQKLFADFYHAGLSHVAMEVSSHALDQDRVKHVEFNTAVFTNLTRDHLDYHIDMERYGAAKLKLFQFFGLHHCIINKDDEFSEKILQTIPSTVEAITYGIENPSALVNASNVSLSNNGISADVITPWGHGKLQSKLLGRFNVYNLLAVLATLCVHDTSFTDAINVIKQLSGVTGRMQCFSRENSPLVVVDYAHTPDALENSLRAAKEHCEGELWCVFGCGGNRDTGKRPQMAAISERLANHVIVTDDNPRHENPQTIATDILRGFRDPSAVTIIHDRTQAIHYAISHAQPNDVILIAGKGHEDYQEIGDQRFPLSDIESVSSILNLQVKRINCV